MEKAIELKREMMPVPTLWQSLGGWYVVTSIVWTSLCLLVAAVHVSGLIQVKYNRDSVRPIHLEVFASK